MVFYVSKVKTTHVRFFPFFSVRFVALWLNDPTTKVSERTNRKLAAMDTLDVAGSLYNFWSCAPTRKRRKATMNSVADGRTDDRMMPIVDHILCGNTMG